MPGSLLTPEVRSVLELQGLGAETRVGALGCEARVIASLTRLVGEDSLRVFTKVEEAARVAKSSEHWVLLAPSSKVAELLQTIGSEVSSTIAVIALGQPDPSGPSAAMLRALGAMAVADDLTDKSLELHLRRGFEFRALRALELLHRCEARRLKRREMDLLGHPPETMTDDLSTFQPPPLPVGPISTYRLEDSSEAFERAYIDRVQLLCESAREAAKYLDVSAATLARRLRREGSSSG